MKMTFQPKKRQRSKVHGFRARMSTPGGRKVLAARRAKGRGKIISLMDQAASNCGLFFSQIPGKEENTFQVYLFVQKTWTGDRKKFHETF